MKKFWNKETCYNEAKKYKTKAEFIKNSHSAYVISTKNNWYKEYDWLIGVRRNYWNKETCYNEAKKYKTKTEFKNACVGAYDVSCKNKWINEWFTDINKKWTYEECELIAKQCTSKTDFKLTNRNAYQAANKKKWMKNFTWLKDERFNLFLDKIDSVYRYYFKETNSVYIGRTLIRRQKNRDREHLFSENDTVYRHAKENNIPVPKMEILETNLTISDGALQEEYWKVYYEKLGFNILNRTATGSIGTLGKNKWTYEVCKEEALKYTSLKDFRKNLHNCYLVCIKNKWLNDFTWLKRIGKPRGYWTLEQCKKAALSCFSKSDFNRKFSGAYDACKRNNWVNQLTFKLV